MGLEGVAGFVALFKSIFGLVSFGDPHSSLTFPLLATELRGVLPGVRGLRKGDLFVNLETHK